MEKYSITELDMKMEMIKTQSKKTAEHSDGNLFQNVYPPNLVQPLSNH
jgi:hypothetical protein